MEIQQSADYKKFKTIKGNRVISPKKVSKIVNDVNKGLNLFPYCPLVVSQNADGTFNIIDGQHRFTAAKELKHPIHFVVAHNIELRDIARMNSNTDKWKYADFMNCYIDLGIKDYEVLKNFCQLHKVEIRMGLSLLMKGKPGSNSKHAEIFMDGKFVVNYETEAEEFMELIDFLFEPYIFNRHANLLEAVYKLREKGLWNVTTMQQKLRAYPNMMDKMASVKNYIYLLEQIYNVRSQNRKTIF